MNSAADHSAPGAAALSAGPDAGAPLRRRNDGRAHQHAAWWAFWLHRASGLALALFLPLHFAALGLSLQGDAALDGMLRWAELPLVKLAEWGLVVLLTLHAGGGLRLLLIEFTPWSGLRKNAIAGAVIVALLVGLAQALALWS